MNVVSVTKRSFGEFVLCDLRKLHDVDVLVFGFDVCGDLSFDEEVNGDGGIFYDLCLLSRDLNCVVMAGCRTELYGILRKSVVVCDRGELLGVSDLNNIEKNSLFYPGFGYRVYQTSKGDIGVVVDKDVLYPESVSTVSNACGSYIISIVDSNDDELISKSVRSNAFMHRIDVFSVAHNSVKVISSNGSEEHIQKEGTNVLNFVPTTNYVDVCTRRKGNYLS